MYDLRTAGGLNTPEHCVPKGPPSIIRDDIFIYVSIYD